MRFPARTASPAGGWLAAGKTQRCAECLTSSRVAGLHDLVAGPPPSSMLTVAALRLQGGAAPQRSQMQLPARAVMGPPSR